MLNWRMTLILLLGLTVAGCGGTATKEAAQRAEQYQRDTAQLQERIKTLEAEVTALKTAPQELLRQAVEAIDKNAFDPAATLLADLEAKYPASPEAAKVPATREKLKQALAVKQKADRAAYDAAVAKAAAESIPEQALKDLRAYLEEHPDTSFKTELGEKMAAYEKRIQAAAEEARKPPIEITAINMGENSIGTPKVTLTVLNRSKKTIDGFEFSISLYDNYDRPVYRYRIDRDGNTYNGIAQDKLQPGGSESWTWTMYGFDLATKYQDFRLRSVHFTDGTTWRP